MSYIQIEIGGKLRGLKYLQYAVIVMAQKADLDNYDATAGYAMVYAGLKCNNYVKDVEDDFTFEQVCDWVDELPEETLLKVFEVFQETQAYKNLIDKGRVEGNGHIESEPITKKKSNRKELKTTS